MAPSLEKLPTEQKKEKRKRTMNPIVNEKSRMMSFIKRKECLKKKAFELATLCDIDVCMIIFGPDGNKEIWPKEPTAVEAIIKKYKAYQEAKNKIKNSKKAENEGADQVTSGESFNNVSSIWDGGLDSSSGEGREALINFGRLLDSKIETVKKRMDMLMMLKKQSVNEKGSKEAEVFLGETDQTTLSYKMDDLSLPFGPAIGCAYNPPTMFAYNPPTMFDAQKTYATPHGSTWPRDYYGDVGSSSSSTSCSDVVWGFPLSNTIGMLEKTGFS